MKKALVLGGIMAGLVALVLASSAFAEDVGVNVNLEEIGGSGITGSAQIGSTTEDLSTTEVLVDMGGLDPGGTHINHIHDGTGCGDGDYGAVVITLTPLEADDTGSASATTTVTETDAGDPVGFPDIANGSHVVIVHDAAGAPASCAPIPEAILETPTAPQPTAAAEPTATVSAPPETGIDGGMNDGGGNLGLVTLVVGALAAFGLASFGIGFAARRSLR